MKYFFDTEFKDDGRTIELISIGLVAEDGRKYYAESAQFDTTDGDEWLQKNVVSKLFGGAYRKSKREIKEEILEFCNLMNYGRPEFWAYYADYDWVVFCQLFGKMLDLPKGYPHYCRDLKQLINTLGEPYVEKQEIGNHRAIDDALWVKDTYEHLNYGYLISVSHRIE